VHSLPDLEDRIAIARDNIRQLIEQAAAVSGGQNEERNADRIAQQTEELEAMVKERTGANAPSRIRQFSDGLRGR
jgi:hypothetical protein